MLACRNIQRSFTRLPKFHRLRTPYNPGVAQVSALSCYARSITQLQNQFYKPAKSSPRALLGSSSPRWIHFSSALFEYEIVYTPPFAESVTEGDIRWEKGVGDFVKEDELVAEIETDKTTLPVTAPASGVIEQVFVPDGEKVEKGMQLFKLKLADGSAVKESAESAPPPPPPTQTSTPPPPVQTLASEIPTTPPPVPEIPTQPLMTKSAAVPPPLPIFPRAATSTTAPAKLTGSGEREESRVKMSRMRLRIAERLKDAQNTAAMLTTFNEIDMSNIMEMRKLHKEAFMKVHGLKLGFLSAFVKASSYALQQMPVVNAVIEENNILYRDYVDISVAVATPRGLVVPVMRNVEQMNFANIEEAINELGEKARKGELAVEDMEGGTFTISNGGVFGSLMGTPIINPPQSAILGMHAINDRPVAINGKVEIRPMMYVALTYDHRLIDGREATTFLKKVKNAIEDPRVILLEI